MAQITAAQIKQLREVSGAGMMDVKKALTDSGGDADKALTALREKGLAGVAKRMGREARNGLVHAYLHRSNPDLPPTIGVLLELNCETDFVAKTGHFQELARDLALHVASADPLYVTAAQIPEELLAKERSIYEAAARDEGKPAAAVERIAEGRLAGFVKQVALVEQPFVKDSKKTIQALLDEAGAALGEKIVVGRFARYRVGEA